MKIGKKISDIFLAEVDWPELFNGILFILLGLVFDYHYGYQIDWSNYIDLCLWYVFFKLAVYCLNLLLQGVINKKLEKVDQLKLTLAELRNLMANFFWVIALLFLSLSFIPLFQIYGRGGLNILSLVIISCIYLGELIFLLREFQRLLSGLSEVVYAFIAAFLLPALYFSLTKDYLKSEIILIIFPCFFLLIAWSICHNLDYKLKGEEISPASIIERIGTRDSLYTAAALISLGSLTLFMHMNMSGLIYKVVVAIAGLAAAVLLFRSVKTQEPNWRRALFIIQLLPMATALALYSSLWLN